MIATNLRSSTVPNEQQSPINLHDPIFADLGDRKLDINWPKDGHAISGHLAPSDHGLKIVFSPDQRQYITLDGKRFHLASFHFHHPSEHWVDGQQHTVELHVVHQSIDDGSLAVVGIFIEPSEDDGPASEMLSVLKGLIAGPAEQRQKATIPTKPAEFLPPSPDEYYRYEGSLTTPNFTENVKWVVMRNPLAMNAQLLNSLIKEFGGEARFTQPLNRRFVLATFKPTAGEASTPPTAGKRRSRQSR
jgi:carbonic anhydrase